MLALGELAGLEFALGVAVTDMFALLLVFELSPALHAALKTARASKIRKAVVRLMKFLQMQKITTVWFQRARLAHIQKPNRDLATRLASPDKTCAVFLSHFHI